MPSRSQNGCGVIPVLQYCKGKKIIWHRICKFKCRKGFKKIKQSQLIVSPRPASRLEQGPCKSKRGSFAGMHFLSVLHQPSQKFNRKKIKRKLYRAIWLHNWLHLSQINSLDPASPWCGGSVLCSGAGWDTAAMTSDGHHAASHSTAHPWAVTPPAWGVWYRLGPPHLKHSFPGAWAVMLRYSHQVKS